MYATAMKFFPDWEITTSTIPNPSVRVKKGTTSVEIVIDKAIALKDFPEEAFVQFKRLFEAVNRGDYEPI